MPEPSPRIAPLEPPSWDEEQRALLEPIAARGPVHNVFKTLIRHPKLFKRWTPFANHILFKSTLAPRERELLILRTAWVTRAEYEWSHHVGIGERAGLSAAEVSRVMAGPEAPGWSPKDAALLRAVDELRRDCRIGEQTWAALTAHLTTAQVMDAIFTIGNYTALAMALNSFGVPLDSGRTGFAR